MLRISCARTAAEEACKPTASTSVLRKKLRLVNWLIMQGYVFTNLPRPLDPSSKLQHSATLSTFLPLAAFRAAVFRAAHISAGRSRSIERRHGVPYALGIERQCLARLPSTRRLPLTRQLKTVVNRQCTLAGQASNYELAVRS